MIFAISFVGVPCLASAAAPTAFGQYSISGGYISASDPVGLNCGGATTGDSPGFLQRQCSDGSNTFTQTIISDGGFEDESFIELGNSTGGIADKQSLTETAGEDVFSSSAAILTGTFLAPGEARVDLNQNLEDTTGPETFFSSFQNVVMGGGCPAMYANCGGIDINQGFKLYVDGFLEFEGDFDLAWTIATAYGSATDGITVYGIVPDDSIHRWDVFQSGQNTGNYTNSGYNNLTSGDSLQDQSFVSTDPLFTYSYDDVSATDPFSTF